MMIELINNLYVRVDQYNYTLQEKTNTFDKEGNVVYKSISYHDSLDKAIKGAVSYKIRKCLQGQERTLEEAIKIIKNINWSFEKVLKDICIGEIAGLEKEENANTVSGKEED